MKIYDFEQISVQRADPELQKKTKNKTEQQIKKKRNERKKRKFLFKKKPVIRNCPFPNLQGS